jgi:hypothetical protein
MNNLKKELYDLCVMYVKQRMDTAKQAIADSQQAAGEETKSSAGDKYETGREMIQQETNRNQAQLNEANKLMVSLNSISVNAICSTAEPGSLVITDNGKFYISISAGAMILNGETFFAVSPSSPMGLKLRGQKIGDAFILNGRQYIVKDIL